MCGCNLKPKSSMKKFDFKKAAKNTAAVSAGAIIAEKGYDMIPEAVPAKAKPFIVMGIGALVPMISKEPLLESLGNGMIAIGAVKAFHAFTDGDAVKGIGENTLPEDGWVPDNVHGLDNDPVVSGLNSDVALVS